MKHNTVRFSVLKYGKEILRIESNPKPFCLNPKRFGLNSFNYSSDFKIHVCNK